MARNPIAVAHQKRSGSHSGSHLNKEMRGSGKGKGKRARHAKHKVKYDGNYT